MFNLLFHRDAVVIIECTLSSFCTDCQNSLKSNLKVKITRCVHYVYLFGIQLRYKPLFNTMILGILLIYFVSWHTTKANYAMIIEELSICAPNSKIVTNYTYTSATRKGPVGQYEILEDIESNSNIQVSTSAQYNSYTGFPLKIPRFNVTKISFCTFISIDSYILPYFRQFIDLEKHCPLKQGVYMIHRSSILSNKKCFIPYGCWNFEIKLWKNGKTFGCLHVLVQILPSLNSVNLKCNKG
uniref:MD-2-related lipid-recognition domain-containing protein n=1 Tax=Sipha flava TaxID=143950 RepID=A0A2S2R4D5_9HEMI